MDNGSVWLVLFQRNQTVLNGQLSEAGKITYTQLAHYTATVSFDSLWGKKQNMSDLCTGFAFCGELENFPLPLA